MSRKFEADHIWDRLTEAGEYGSTVITDWEWCSIHGEVRKGTLTRHPLASLEPATAPDSGPLSLVPPPLNNRSESSVRAPIKHVADPDPAIRREQFLVRARFFYRDTKGKDYIPKQSELDEFADSRERMYQMSQQPLPEEMECTCPWQWPKLLQGTFDSIIEHKEPCKMVGLTRLGTKQYFDGRKGNYGGKRPRS